MVIFAPKQKGVAVPARQAYSHCASVGRRQVQPGHRRHRAPAGSPDHVVPTHLLHRPLGALEAGSGSRPSPPPTGPGCRRCRQPEAVGQDHRWCVSAPSPSPSRSGSSSGEPIRNSPGGIQRIRCATPLTRIRPSSRTRRRRTAAQPGARKTFPAARKARYSSSLHQKPWGRRKVWLTAGAVLPRFALADVNPCRPPSDAPPGDPERPPPVSQFHEQPFSAAPDPHRPFGPHDPIQIQPATADLQPQRRRQPAAATRIRRSSATWGWAALPAGSAAGSICQ